MNFCRRLRSRPWARTSILVVTVESNYGGRPRSAEFVNRLKHLTPIQFVSEDTTGQGRAGIWVDHDYKERFVQHYNQLLREKTLFWHYEVETVNKDPKGVLINQMRNFRRQYRKPGSDTRFSEDKLPYKYTGKAKGQTDDVMMSLLENCYFLERWLSNPYTMGRFGGLAISNAEYRMKNIERLPNGGVAMKWSEQKRDVLSRPGGGGSTRSAGSGGPDR